MVMSGALGLLVFSSLVILLSGISEEAWLKLLVCWMSFVDWPAGQGQICCWLDIWMEMLVCFIINLHKHIIHLYSAKCMPNDLYYLLTKICWLVPLLKKWKMLHYYTSCLLITVNISKTREIFVLFRCDTVCKIYFTK